MRANRGNALFLILIAVALFAALSYAVTQSGRGSGGIDREKAALTAAQAAQIVGSIQQSVTRATLGGLPYASMQFWDGNDCTINYTLCDSGSSCLFAPEGGGLTLPVFPNDIFTAKVAGTGYPGRPATTADSSFWVDCDNGTSDWGVGTSGHERGFYLLNVKQDVCLAFNKGLGISSIPTITDAQIGTVGQQTICLYRDHGGYQQYEIWQAIYVQ